MQCSKLPQAPCDAADALAAQGKGANTPFILESRGVNRAETMSSLLERHPGIRELMDRGELVPDTMVRIWEPFQACMQCSAVLRLSHHLNGQGLRHDVTCGP